MHSWTVERLATHHDRNGFSCGNGALDRYIKHQVGQDERRYIASAFVAVYGPGSSSIGGYYTISAFGIDSHALPKDIVTKLPRYPLLPAILLGRLAVDRGQQGKGLGRLLMIDALKRIVAQSQVGAAAAFVAVDAIDADAASFYRYFGFLDFLDLENRLYLPTVTIAKLVREEGL